jgi:hypothetical protein
MRCRSTTPLWTSRAGKSAQEESEHRLKDSKWKDRASNQGPVFVVGFQGGL